MIYDCEQPALADEERTNTQDEVVNNNDNSLLYHVSDADILFAKERWHLHKTTPDEGVSLQVLKNYISKKYGI